MRSTLSLFLTVFLTISMNAQLGIHKKRLAEGESIKNLPLLVVLLDDDDPDNEKMNILLKEAFEKYWTYSQPYEFVTKKQGKEYSKDNSKKNNYAYFMYSERVYKANVPEEVFCIGLLNKSIFTHFKKFGNPDKELTLADYKFGLYWLQKDLTLPNGKKDIDNRLKESISEFKERISKDTLLIDEDLFTEKLKRSIPELYNYNYRIVSKEVIDKAIIDESPNILYVKSLQTLSRPTTKSSRNSTPNTINVNAIVTNNIYSADNQELLVQISTGTIYGKSNIRHFKKMLKTIDYIKI